MVGGVAVIFAAYGVRQAKTKYEGLEAKEIELRDQLSSLKTEISKLRDVALATEYREVCMTAAKQELNDLSTTQCDQPLP